MLTMGLEIKGKGREGVVKDTTPHVFVSSYNFKNDELKDISQHIVNEQ